MFGIGRKLKRTFSKTYDRTRRFSERQRDIAEVSDELLTGLFPKRIEENRQPDDAILARAEEILRSAIALGREGRLAIVPEFISISATDNCNLRCIMCPGHSGMKGPRLSVEQANSLFAGLETNRAHFGETKFLDMTAGEPLLNTQLNEIFRNFKAAVPTGKISIISNATLPVKGRVKETFGLCDRIGLSMDGATKETYERIRKGSVFDNVVRNVRDIAELKQNGANCELLTIMFVAMDQNAHELPELIRLAKDVGVPAVFAQEVEIRTTPFLAEGDNMDFEMPPSELRRYMDEAQTEADRLGIKFSPTNGLVERSMEKPEVEKDSKATVIASLVNTSSFEERVKFCHVPWFNSNRFNHNADGVRPSTVCCHMPAEGRHDIFNQKDLRGMSINSIFNSNYYWQVREELLDGTLARGACRGCQYYESTQWRPDQLRALEAAVIDARKGETDTG